MIKYLCLFLYFMIHKKYMTYHNCRYKTIQNNYYDRKQIILNNNNHIYYDNITYNKNNLNYNITNSKYNNTNRNYSLNTGFEDCAIIPLRMIPKNDFKW